MTTADVGVYLHVPFCDRVCPYCDFAVVAARNLTMAREAAYVDALLAELAVRAPAFSGRVLASLYFGGGTPSLLRPESVARLIAAVEATFDAPAPLEVTLEVNPSTVERDRMSGFRDAGVNRVSVGVQSFDDAVLKRLGRAHPAREAHETLAAARTAGFERISLDLIYGAPGQSPSALANDLAEVVAFSPDHVSAYELTLEAGTPFGEAAANGKLEVCDEDALRALQSQVAEGLEASGYGRYEVSSYAHVGCEAVHNRRYWERRPVLGLGMGAFSTDPPTEIEPHGARVSNSRDLANYLAAVKAARPGQREPLSPSVARGEAVFLALRTREGLDAERFAAEFGAFPRQFFGETIDRLSGEGMLEERSGGDLVLTPRGLELSDSVAMHFV